MVIIGEWWKIFGKVIIGARLKGGVENR